MGFDSAAELLFNIGANTDDAESNVQRFRGLLGTDLDQLGEQFASWSEEVFGDLETVRGAFLGITAAAGAAAVAAIGFAVEAGNKAEEYALQIGDARDQTGLTTETLSAMHVAAHEVGIGFDQVVGGVRRLERAVFEAQDPTSKQAQALGRMGFSTAQLRAAVTDVTPFLQDFAKRFKELPDGPEKTGIAMEFMGRSGTEMIRFLQAWGDETERFRKTARALGIQLSTEDINAARQYQAGIKELSAEWEGFVITLGNKVMPAIKAVVVGIGGLVEAIKSGATNVFSFSAAFAIGATEMTQKMEEIAKLGRTSEVIKALAPKPAEVKAALENFHSLTGVLDEMRIKVAALDGPESKLAAEMDQLRDKVSQSVVELNKLNDAHKLAPGVLERETGAWVQIGAAVAKYSESMKKAFAEKELSEMQRYLDAIEAAGKDLAGKLDAQAEATYQRQLARWAEEIEGLRQKMAKELTLTTENQAALEKLREAGIKRIQDLQQQNYNHALQAAQDHSAKLLEANMTTEQKLAVQYQLDLEKFSQAEAAKVAKVALTTQQAEALEKQYAQIRSQLTLQHQQELQKLFNSQGWQGIFGNFFAQSIRGNANLMKEWAESTNQSTLMVKVAIQSLKEDFQDFFNQEAQAMGQSIANALVYSKSIGQAFQAGTAAALEALAARAATQAIYATAEGFMDLGNPATVPFAAPAFQAAAMFAVIAGASGLAGRAIAPSQGASGGAGGGAGATRSGSGSGSSYGNSGGTMGQSGARVEVNVYGHVFGTSGVDQIADMLNQAVQGRNVKLLATQVKNLTPLQH